MEAGEACFVCLEEGGGARARVCRCATRVHLDCMRQVLERVPAHADGRCPVCRERYACVEEYSVRRWCVVADPDLAWLDAGALAAALGAAGAGAHALAVPAGPSSRASGPPCASSCWPSPPRSASPASWCDGTAAAARRRAGALRHPAVVDEPRRRVRPRTAAAGGSPAAAVA